MRVLLLTHGFNSLSQRLFVELEAAGHEVSVEFDIHDAVTEEAVRLFRPDVLVAPFLKRAIPERVWRALPCFIVHPGVPGDRGPSALDWAILEDAPGWGVTVLQAEAEMDAGPVWASRAFPMRAATKSSLYRNEVTEAAIAGVLEALERFAGGGFRPERVDGRARPAVTQADRAIDWTRDSTETVLRKIRGGDGSPGVRDEIGGRRVYLYDAQPASPFTLSLLHDLEHVPKKRALASREKVRENEEPEPRSDAIGPEEAPSGPHPERALGSGTASALSAEVDAAFPPASTMKQRTDAPLQCRSGEGSTAPSGEAHTGFPLTSAAKQGTRAALRYRSGGPGGEVIAVSGPAICRLTVDGAVWIGHLRDPKAENLKLPAVRVLGEAAAGLPEIAMDSEGGYGEIRYEEEGGAGFLHFTPYNGAFGGDTCARLLAAYCAALARPTRVLALMGGPDFWSNGINLNLIEAAMNPADESWRNINAIDDLAEAILRTDDRLTVAALAGNAGAGGVYLARAADEVWLREGVVLSPHYKDMGNLYGSEFWTYSLPRRAGAEAAAAIMRRRLPMGPAEAVRARLADDRFGATVPAFIAEAKRRAIALAAAPDYAARLGAKRAARAADEAAKPLAQYRAEELERMRLNFYGFDPSYHVARHNFVRKVVKSRTPVTLARHRDGRRGLR